MTETKQNVVLAALSSKGLSWVLFVICDRYKTVTARRDGSPSSIVIFSVAM
jgi:hypothetical protein